MKKLAIITTHPIQYNAPLFEMLSRRNQITIKVFYTWHDAQDKIFDSKFGRQIKWDIPLLRGYDYCFVKNTSTNQNTRHFGGMVNPTLNQEIEQWQADAVLVYGWNFKSHFGAMRYFKNKIAVFFRGDSTLLDEKQNIKQIVRRLWLTYVYRYVDCGLYVGSNNKDYFLKHRLKENQLIFAPHSIDNSRFADNNGEYLQKAVAWRKELGIAETDKVVLFVGKFEPKKNPLLLLTLANKLENMKNLKFVFVGNGELEETMKAKQSNNMIFLPFQNQSIMPVVYRLGNILVLPSTHNETWGLVINEALVCGLSIIASHKVGSARDLVLADKTGYVFESNNLNELESCLFRVLSPQFVYNNEIINTFSYEKLCEAIEKL